MNELTRYFFAYISIFFLKKRGLTNDACPWWFMPHEKIYSSETTRMYTSDFCVIPDIGVFFEFQKMLLNLCLEKNMILCYTTEDSC